MSNVFLHAPRNFHNLCLLARTLEVFGQSSCYVFDPHGLVREHYGKYRTRELRVVSAGAYQKIRWIHVETPLSFLAAHPGRIVATVAEPASVPLAQYRFEPTDLLLFGSENHGLPDDVVRASAARVTIPSRGQTESLNLSVALGIVLFEFQRQLDAALSG